MSTGTVLFYAFTTGMLAAINPCGFALLPAYLSYYLGLESKEPEDRPSTFAVLVRALVVSASMTAGFIVVFGLIGAAWSSVQTVVLDRLPWVMVGLGIALAILGIFMLAGYTPTVRVPKLATTSGSQSAWSAFVFGVSYGVASLSCTMPIFLAAVTTTFGRHNFLVGFGALLVYGAGMGTIITVLTVAVSFARQGVAARMRKLLPYMGRISGVLLIISGIVASYYGWYEAKVLSGEQPENGFAETIAGWQSSATRWITDVGAGRIGIGVAVVIAAAVAISLLVRHGRVGTHGPDSSD